MNLTLNSDLQTALFWDRVMHSQENGEASYLKPDNPIDGPEKAARHPDTQCKSNVFRVNLGWPPGMQNLTNCGFTKSIPREI